jgi:signal transduction histidine kinase
MRLTGIEVTTDYCRLPRVSADEHQLQQVFMNIIVNAEQAINSAKKGGTILVKTERRNTEKEDLAVIRISDDGPGIDRRNAERVFDPFFTTKPVGQGTGLGLSIAYGVIKEHGGSIRIECLPGNGATFIVELPVAAGQ